MEPEWPWIGRDRNAAGAQIGLGERAGERAGRYQEPARSLQGRSLRLRRSNRHGLRQSEEPVRFGNDLGEMIEAATQAYEVEKIAALAGGGISPAAAGPFAGQRSGQADIEAAPRRVGDIADDPVVAMAVAVGEILAAYSLGIVREAASKLGGLRGHGASLPYDCEASD
jgi:hypothetical protein